MKLYLRTLPLIAAAFSIACSGDLPTTPSSMTAISAKKDADHGKPFGGRCDTKLQVVGGTETSVSLRITYVCQLEHMGRTTAVADQVVTFTGPTTAIASNTTTYTADNGDQLFATWTGTANSVGPVSTFSGPESYTGGTGRFAGASGSSIIAGTASFATMSGSFALTGRLNY